MTDYLQNPVNLDDPTLPAIFDELSFWSARFGALLFEHLELATGITALDLGCGAGFPLFELAQAHGATCRFIGVDLWEAALRRALFKGRTYGLRHASAICADGGRLPLPDACVDLIVSNVGINNFADPSAVLGECRRVGKAGGRLVFTTNVMGHLQTFYAVFRAVLTELGNADYLRRLDANEQHRGNRETLTKLLEDAGFSVTRIIENQFFLRYVDGSAFLRHFLTRVGFLPAWRAVVTEEDEQAIFAKVEARLNALAKEAGDLRLRVPMLYVEGRL